MHERKIERKIMNTTVGVMTGDITLLDIDAFVYYARPDLKLGTGVGGAISARGGPTIQKELDQVGPLTTGQVVATGAGDLLAKHIIHAVGPRFQEQDTEGKLRTTVEAALELADTSGVTGIALPPMGCGFYGVPLDLSARVMFETIKRHLSGKTHLSQIVVCVLDNREYGPFAKELEALA